MSLTDDLFRNKWANGHVPDKYRNKFKEAVELWDKQNPTMAGTFNEHVMSTLLMHVMGPTNEQRQLEERQKVISDVVNPAPPSPKPLNPTLSDTNNSIPRKG